MNELRYTIAIMLLVFTSLNIISIIKGMIPSKERRRIKRLFKKWEKEDN